MRNTSGPTAEEPASDCDPDIARHWAKEPDDNAGRTAEKRRQAIKGAVWITVERALEIQGTADETHLRKAIKEGLPCRFQHRGRWWRWKPVEGVVPLLTGRNPLDLVDACWELVIHERYWRERLGKAGAPASSADVRKESNAGAPLQHDWDEADAYLQKLWVERGDPRDPLHAEEGWRSDIDIARKVANHLQKFEPDQEPPDPKTVAKKLRPTIKKLRGQ